MHPNWKDHSKRVGLKEATAEVRTAAAGVFAPHELAALRKLTPVHYWVPMDDTTFPLPNLTIESNAF